MIKYRKLAAPYYPDAFSTKPKTAVDTTRVVTVRRISRKKSAAQAPAAMPNGNEITEKTFLPATHPSNLSDAEWESVQTKLKTQFKSIMDTYVTPGSPREANLPVKTRKVIDENYVQGIIHPNLLVKGYEHIYNMLRENSLFKFLKKTYFASPAAPAVMELPKVSMRQLIMSELVSPYTYDDFLNYLKQEVFEINVALSRKFGISQQDSLVFQCRCSLFPKSFEFG